MRLELDQKGFPAMDAVNDEIQVRRELVRSIILFFMAAILIMLPATFFIPNHFVWLIIVIVELICLFSLKVNQSGRTLLAGIIIVTTCEIGTAMVIMTTHPLEVFNLPLFDIFVMGVLLAVSLLPARSVWIVVAINITFILMHLLIGPHSQQLTLILKTQFYNALARPAGLQVMVAGTAFLWIHRLNRAIIQAYRAQKQAQFVMLQLGQRQENLERALAKAQQELADFQTRLSEEKHD